MRRYFRVPLFFLVVASLLGVFLRWQFIHPTAGVNFRNFLHGHSHIMFLGWVFNALYIGFTTNFIEEKEQKIFQWLFLLLQGFTVVMLVSFPLQGYGFVSILVSTLHTFVAFFFVVLFFRKTGSKKSISLWYARIALIFLCISSAGPFSLGYWMTQGMGQSHWYYFSIYYYLHFQYNGFFFFGIMSLFFEMLAQRNITIGNTAARIIGKLMATACVLSFSLSLLWAKPDAIFFWLGSAGALLQLYALGWFIFLLKKNSASIREQIHPSLLLFLRIVLALCVLKQALQLLSAHPVLAQLAYEYRSIFIAYLHLALVGIISLFLLVWYALRCSTNVLGTKRALAIVTTAFVGMEFCLTILPWRQKISGSYFSADVLQGCLFIFSLLLATGFLFFLLSLRANKPDKNHVAD